MAQLILHIGGPKTASTHFQYFLEANVARLNDNGIGYPDFCETVIHVELQLAAATQIRVGHRARGINNDAELAIYRNQMRDNLRRLAATHPVVIMSSETLPVVADDAWVDSLRDLVEDAFDSIDVVYFVRRQDFLASSMYNQHMQDGQRFGMGETYFEKNGPANLRFDTIVNRWNEHFGRDRMHVVPYLERFKDEPTAVAERVLSFAGGEAIGSLESWAIPQVTNISMSGKGVEMLRIVNPYATPWSGATLNPYRRDLRIEVSARFPGPSVKPTSEALEIVERDYFPTNELLRDLVDWNLEWDEWMAQPSPRTQEPQLPTLAEVAETMTQLSAPRGPIVWRWPVPQATPKRRLHQRAKSFIKRSVKSRSRD